MSFKEIRNNFYNEEDKCICIDAWRTNNPNEEGTVVARVYRDKIEYKYPQYAKDERIGEYVKEAQEELKDIY